MGAALTEKSSVAVVVAQTGQEVQHGRVVGRDSINGSAAESQWKRKRGALPRTILFVPSARLCFAGSREL
jgi:hypothetical protein